jgi:hypothetical protein
MATGRPRPPVQQPSRRTARSRCRTAFDLAGWYTPGPRPATPGRRSSSDTLTPTAARRCSTGCVSCARATSSPSPAPTAHRYALSSSAPSSIQGPVPDRRRLLPHPDAHSAAGDLRRGIRPRHRPLPVQCDLLRHHGALTCPPGSTGLQPTLVHDLPVVGQGLGEPS